MKKKERKERKEKKRKERKKGKKNILLHPTYPQPGIHELKNLKNE